MHFTKNKFRPDSVALLHSLYQLREEYQISLFVVHLNHMFRGREAEEDAEFVAKMGQRLDIPSFIESVNVPRIMEETGLSAQLAARQVRYQLYERILAQEGAQKIALGHHGDDQAETILMRFLRGAGADGLTGIPPVRERIIRPLLEVSRQEIENYCQEQELAFRTDYSNLKTIYLRNKIRLELLPLLEKEYNSNIRQTLVRLGDILRADSYYLQEKALEALEEALIRFEEGRMILSWEKISAHSKALQRRIYRESIRKVRGNLDNISFEHLEDLLDFFLREERGQKTLPGGLLIEKSYGNILIKSKESQEEFTYKLQIPGSTSIPELGMKIISKLIENPSLAKPKVDIPWQAYLDYYPACGELVVRNRREGDRIRPLGMTGSKKLKEFFIDQKIPRYERDRIPLVAQGSEILWIVGKRLGNKRELPKHDKQVLFLQVEFGDERRKE